MELIQAEKWYPEKGALPILFLLAIVFYLLGSTIHLRYLHPLGAYPGPLLYSISRLPYCCLTISGDPIPTILALHERYGDVVRVAPDALSYLRPDAWEQIMGHRKHGTEENGKDSLLADSGQKYPDIVNSNGETHRRFRRLLSHGFSATALSDQQVFIDKHINMLISKLRSLCLGGPMPLDLVKWYDWTTFDITGDLTFGESFHCLETGEYHPWVSLLSESIKAIALLRLLNYYPLLRMLKRYLVPKSLVEKRLTRQALTRERVASRITSGTNRQDLVYAAIEKGQNGMSIQELETNSDLLVIAGSETTGSSLSSITYCLLTHPHWYKKLQAEIRTTFEKEQDIDYHAVQKLDSLHAIVKESLRLFPPIPVSLPRRTPPAGNLICGRYVPGNTVLGVWHLAMYRYHGHFRDPDAFRPERWLGDESFSSDEKDAFQPFQLGSRACLGKNLAFRMIELVLARILYSFDLELAGESADWGHRLQIYGVWQKPPLMVHLRPRTLL